MRQSGDSAFAEMLCRVRTADCTPADNTRSILLLSTNSSNRTFQCSPSSHTYSIVLLSVTSAFQCSLFGHMHSILPLSTNGATLAF